jgi:putative hemolysin
MFFFLKKEGDISKEELKHVLKISEDHGILPSGEAELVRGYLSLQEMSVKELMHPREDMLRFDINDPLNKLFILFKEKKRSRIPVIDKEVDNMIGIISAKQFFIHRHEILFSKDIKNWLTKPFYIPENTPGRLLLKHFNNKNEEMAIAVDEYGSISGLITKQDILEAMLGYPLESPETEMQYTQAGKNEIIASGKLELSSFNEIFSSNLQSPSNMMTIGGWLTEQLDEIPKSGTKYKTQEFLFHVLAADLNRIRRIYIRKLTKTNQKAAFRPRKKNI